VFREYGIVCLFPDFFFPFVQVWALCRIGGFAALTAGAVSTAADTEALLMSKLNGALWRQQPIPKNCVFVDRGFLESGQFVKTHPLLSPDAQVPGHSGAFVPSAPRRVPTYCSSHAPVTNAPD